MPALSLRTEETVKARKNEIALVKTAKILMFAIRLGERQSHVSELAQV